MFSLTNLPRLTRPMVDVCIGIGAAVVAGLAIGFRLARRRS